MSGTDSGQFRSVTWYNRNRQCNRNLTDFTYNKNKEKRRIAIPFCHYNKRVLLV